MKARLRKYVRILSIELEDLADHCEELVSQYRDGYERGEITECTIANIVVVTGGRHLTPPVSCGLLPGTYRAELLEAGEIEEGVIRKEDLAGADEVYLVNSVRGLTRAVVVD